MAASSASAAPPSKGVRVLIRVRPQNKIESSKGGSLNTDLRIAPAGHENEIDYGATGSLSNPPKRFTFDGVFSPESQQEDVFDLVGQPAVDAVLDGYNGTILAYGQTSSGKTHTMLGPSGGAPELLASPDRGIVPRVFDELLGRLAAIPEAELSWAVELSVFELYNEELFDLVSQSPKGGGDSASSPGEASTAAPSAASSGDLRIREDRTGGRGVYVEGLCAVKVRKAEEALEIIGDAARRKHTAGTQANETSSRSHTIVQVYVTQTSHVEAGTKTRAQLFLVDLAGSERIDKTGAEGQRLKEAQNINLSLTLLGNVINKLTDSRCLHVPYRDSKLTRLLQDSLGGNSLTTLLCACSPSTFNASETLSTLHFANRAKKIENKPRANKTLSDDELRKAYQRALDEIDVLTDRVRTLEGLAGSGGDRGSNVNNTAASPAGTGAKAASFSRKSDTTADSSSSVARIAELEDAVRSLSKEVQAEREETQSREAELQAVNARISFYQEREQKATEKAAEWKAKYEREKLAADSWSRKFNAMMGGGGGGGGGPANPGSARRGSSSVAPQPPAELAATSSSSFRRSGSSTGRTTTTTAAAGTKKKPPTTTSKTGKKGGKTTSATSADDDPATPPTTPPEQKVGGGDDAPSAEEREARGLVRERMMLQQIDDLRDRVQEGAKYPIIIERLTKDLALLKDESERKLERQVNEYEDLLKRQDEEIGRLQLKLDERVAQQQSRREDTVGELGRLRAENDILHDENRANASRLIDFAKRAETLEKDVRDVTADRDRLRRAIEASNLSEQAKSKILGDALKQQRSNFRKKLLECFARDNDDDDG